MEEAMSAESPGSNSNFWVMRGAIDYMGSCVGDLGREIFGFGAELAPPGNGDSGELRVYRQGSPEELHPTSQGDISLIAREALRNAIRHANASRIEAEITYFKHMLRLRIRDNGIGIDRNPTAEGIEERGGLQLMEQHASKIGAQLAIWSAVGAGTEVELTVPASIAYAEPQPRRRGGSAIAQLFL